MHVLLIPSFYYSPANRTGTFFHDQAMALHRAGHQVGVLVTPRIEVTLYELRRRGLSALKPVIVEDHDGLPVYRMHRGWFPRFFPRIHAFLVKRAGLRAFEDYVQAHGKPDLLHAHNTFYGGYLATGIKARWSIPVVLTEHSTNFLSGRVFLPGQHQVVRHTLSHIDKGLAVGPALAAKLQEFAPECAVDVVGNVLDTAFFVPGTAPPPEKPFVFTAIGLLIRRKGFDVLLQAFGRAFRGQEVRLDIGGDGKLRRELERLAGELGITAQVNFLGRLPREQVRAQMQRSHVIVSSSAVETFGVTLIEAMACGKPVIATRSGGPESFVDASNGLLVPVGDVAALADAMQYMMANYRQYDPQAIRAGCVARFSEAAIVRRLEAVYAEVL